MNITKTENKNKIQSFFTSKETGDIFLGGVLVV